MNLSSEKDLKQYLIKVGLIDDGDKFEAERLHGGVSCQVWKTVIKGDTYVLKGALPKLNVGADWYADQERTRREHEVMDYLFDLLPKGTVPKVYYRDYGNHIYLMDYVAAAQTWKDILLNEDFDCAIARKSATLLKCIHTGSSTAGEAVTHKIGSQRYFAQLRINPFHRYIVERYPVLAQPVSRLIRELTGEQLCLVHGDFSPKNILVDQHRNVVFIDFEVAHWGNPVFDLAYCTGHLLLKGWHLDKREAVIEVVDTFLSAYCGDTSRLIPHLGLMLLARIDGKSPVDYITSENLKTKIRKISFEWIQYEADKTESITAMKTKYLAS